MAADVPAPWVDVQTDTFDIAEEALFQRRNRFKRALDSLRENSLTPAEQIAELGSVEGAQQAPQSASGACGHDGVCDEHESDQAMAAYRTASRLFPGSHIPWLGIGMEYLRTNHLHLALQYIRQAQEICPYEPLVLHELGHLPHRGEEFEFAGFDFKVLRADRRRERLLRVIRREPPPPEAPAQD